MPDGFLVNWLAKGTKIRYRTRPMSKDMTPKRRLEEIGRSETGDDP